MPRLLSPLLLLGAVPAQAAWTSVSLSAGPSARTEVQMHSDGAGALLFGGQFGPGQTAFDELWRFDGASWSQQPPASGPTPPARSRFAATFDPVRQRLVVFGGDLQYNGGGAAGDTWEWDPATSTWTQASPVNQPSPRVHARMAYDLLNARVLLFGGSGVGAGETWHWDGVDWTLLAPATAPPPRQQPNMTTDWATGRVWMFGGSSGAASGVLGDTWVWDGVDWSQVVTATTPGGTGIRNGKADYDRLRGRVVVFGGVRGVGGFSNSAWEFDGVDWVERLPQPGPAGRAGMGFCYVDALQTSVMFGGYNGGLFADTWSYQTDAPATAVTSGSGCASGGVTPTLAVQPPWLGDTVTWTVGNLPANGLPVVLVGTSGSVWAGGALPFNLAPLGFPACDLLVSTETSTFAPAGLSLAIPQQASLIGFEMHSQAAVLTPQAAGFDLAMSAAQVQTLGSR